MYVFYVVLVKYQPYKDVECRTDFFQFKIDFCSFLPQPNKIQNPGIL